MNIIFSRVKCNKKAAFKAKANFKKSIDERLNKFFNPEKNYKKSYTEILNKFFSGKFK